MIETLVEEVKPIFDGNFELDYVEDSISVVFFPQSKFQRKEQNQEIFC